MMRGDGIAGFSFAPPFGDGTGLDGGSGGSRLNPRDGGGCGGAVGGDGNADGAGGAASGSGTTRLDFGVGISSVTAFGATGSGAGRISVGGKISGDGTGL